MLKAPLFGGFFLRVSILWTVIILLNSCTASKEEEYCVFRYNEPAGIPTLDPAFAKEKSSIWAVQQLFDGLVTLDSANQLQPELATDWKVNTAGTRYEFSLREAYFHNGWRITAHDVVFSLNRLRNPKLASPGSWLMDPVDTLYTLDSAHLVIELVRPFASFLSTLAMPFAAVVPSDSLLETQLSTAPVGSGPFKFHIWYFGDRLILHSFENYWKTRSNGTPLPLIDGIAVSFIPDQQSAFLEYLQGNFDFLPNLDPSFKDELLTKDGALNVQYTANHTLHRSPFLNTEYLIFNADIPLERDLRWAINAAIDRETMIKELRNGVGVPALGGLIPSGLPEFSSARGISYQPDSVTRLLQTKKELPFLTLTTVANYRDLCEYVQGALAKVGWDIAVDVVPSATLRAQKTTGALSFFRASWIADYPDAENYMMLFASAYQAPNGPNYSRYANTQFDQLYNRAAELPYGELRSQLLSEADSLLMQDAALVPLYYDEVLRVTPTYIHGIQTNALNALMLEEVERW